MDLNPIGWGAVGFSFSSAAWVVRGVKFQGWAGKIHFSLTPGAWKNIESCWIAQRSSSRLRTQHGQPANTCRLVQNLSMADELDPDVEYILLNKPLGDWIFAHDFALALVRIWCTLLASLCLRIFVDICSVCTEGMFSSLLAGRQAILLFSFGCCFCLPIFHVLRRDAKVYQAGGRTWMQRLIRAACRRDAMESGSFSQVPPAASASGHKAADWKVRMTPKKIWCEKIAQKFEVTVDLACAGFFGRINAIRSLCWYDLWKKEKRCKHFGKMILKNAQNTFLRPFHSGGLVSHLVTWFDTRTGGCRKQFGVEMSGSLARARIWPFVTRHQPDPIAVIVPLALGARLLPPMNFSPQSAQC